MQGGLDWGMVAEGRKKTTDVFAVAQAGGVMSTWTQMGAMGPL